MSESFYAVLSGDLLRCVRAKSHKKATKKAIRESGYGEPNLGEWIEVHRHGDREDQHTFFKTDKILRKMGLFDKKGGEG